MTKVTQPEAAPRGEKLLDATGSLGVPVVPELHGKYLSPSQVIELGALLKTFFTLPYSTDLDGKDAETLLRIIKKAEGPRSKRKELFDIIDGSVGYSVKTLKKSSTAVRVDLQEQRFCDVDEVRRMRAEGGENAAKQGAILLEYMLTRIREQMTARGISQAKSLILLKNWDAARKRFSFVYWEEDFLGYVQDLVDRNRNSEIEWIVQDAGLHARDKLRQVQRGDGSSENIRLLRMHYKHNQIFTDHDIPKDADKMSFTTNPMTWEELGKILDTQDLNRDEKEGGVDGA